MPKVTSQAYLVLFLAFIMLAVPILGTAPDDGGDVPATSDVEVRSGGSVGPLADTEDPKYYSFAKTPMYPGPTTKVNVTALIHDESNPVNVTVKYGPDNSTWTDLGSIERNMSKDSSVRNPTSGTVLRGPISGTYSMSPGGRLYHLYVYVWSSDRDTLYINVEGYDPDTNTWKRIFYQYSYSPFHGVKVNKNLMDQGYTKWRITYRDYETDDRIYYTATWTEISPITFELPGAGQNDKMYVHFNATDNASNSAVYVYSYSIDRVVPVVKDMTTFTYLVYSPQPLAIYANVTDNNDVGLVFLNWSTDNVTWHLVPMDHLTGSGPSKQFMARIPMPISNTTLYYRIEAYDAGSNHASGTAATLDWDPPPTVVNVTATPHIINATGTATITANILDLDGVTSARVAYRLGTGGTETLVNMTQGVGDEWSANISSPGVTTRVYYHITVFDILGIPFNTTKYVFIVDTDVPVFTNEGHDPTYPNCTETVTFDTTAYDALSSMEVWLDYKLGQSGTVQSVYQGIAGQNESTDRNPATGESTTTLSRYYYAPSGSTIGRVTLKVFAWDHQGVYLQLRGYSSSTGWQNIYYSTSTNDGIKVDTSVEAKGYDRLYVNFYDVSGSPFSYSISYTTFNKDFSLSVPGPGYSTLVYYRARGVDQVGNSKTSDWYSYWADGTKPVLSSHKSPGVKEATTQVLLTATFKDESHIERAQLFYSFGTDKVHLFNMTQSFRNSTHLGASGIVPKTSIPLEVSYYFRYFDSAGNNNTTKVFKYRTQINDLMEGVYSNFDSSILEANAGIIKWQWDFDYNGTFNQDRGGQKVRHRYYDNGTYTVLLRITDAVFDITEITFTTVALDASPTASVVEVGEVAEGQLVALDGSPSLSFPDFIVLFEWDPDYDGNTFDIDATGMFYNHTFMSNGTFVVALRVTDDDGSPSIETIEVTVTDAKPDLRIDYLLIVDEGVPVTFNASGTVSWPDNLDRIEWDMEFTGTFVKDLNGTIVNHTFMDDGVYRFMARAYDDDGSMTQLIGTVTVNDVGPVVNITAGSRVNEGTPLELDGSDSSSFPDALVSYEWDLHFDGTFEVEDTGPTSSVTYMDNGNYTVALRVTDDDGSAPIATHDVVVADLSPVATIIMPTEVDEGASVDIAVNVVSFPDEIVTLDWDFYYDGVSFGRSAVGEEVEFTYMDNGTYTIALRAIDDDGSTVIETLVIEVFDLGPLAIGTLSGDFIEGQKLILDGRPSTSYPDEMVSLEWDLGYDGDTFDVDLSTSVAEHTYMDHGTYTIALRVTDDDGSWDIFEQTFTISDLGPTAVISVGTSHREGDLVTFSAVSSTSYPDELVAYHWDWDSDGEVDETTQKVNGMHTFNQPGRYDVTLTVEDDDGTADSTSVLITITNVGPIARLEAITTPEGEPVLLDASATEEPGSDFVAFRWDVDGDMVWDVEGTDPTLVRTWDTPGSYAISMEVEDADGSKASKSITLKILDVAPVADAGGPYQVEEGTPLTLDASGSHEPGSHFTSFKWDLYDDGTIDGEGIALVWTFTLAGEYTIRLVVEDVDGSTGETTTTLVVSDRDPEFDIVLPTDVMENVPANFTLDNLFDPGTEDFIVTWHFGDGVTARRLTAEHAFAEQGTYHGHVVVEDNDGTAVTVKWPSPVIVTNSPPVVELSTLLLEATEDREFTLSVFGQDTANDTVTYDFKGPGGKIDEQTGVFKWTPLDDHVGSNKFTFIARDEDGGEGTLVVKIDVEDVDNDFMGQPFAVGMGVIIAIVLVAIAAIFIVARQRKKAEEDLIEAEDKVDLKAEVEVDLDPGPAPVAVPAATKPPGARPPPKKRPPGQRPPPRKRPPGSPPPKQRPPGQRPPPKKKRPPGAPPPKKRPPPKE